MVKHEVIVLNMLNIPLNKLPVTMRNNASEFVNYS